MSEDVIEKEKLEKLVEQYKHLTSIKDYWKAYGATAFPEGIHNVNDKYKFIALQNAFVGGVAAALNMLIDNKLKPYDTMEDIKKGCLEMMEEIKNMPR